MKIKRIKKIKGNGVEVIDDMREKIAFTDKERKSLEKIYKENKKRISPVLPDFPKAATPEKTEGYFEKRFNEIK